MPRSAPIVVVFLLGLVLVATALVGAQTRGQSESSASPSGLAASGSPGRSPSPSSSAGTDSPAPSGSPAAPPAAPGALDAVVSSVSALARCSLPGEGTTYTNSEVEPFVAVNPRDAANIIAVWQQDRSSTGGARGIVTATSHDGGTTWRRVAAPFGNCAVGKPIDQPGFERVSDPWISCGPAACFQSALGVADDGRSAILASRSTDGGRTWEAARLVAEDRTANGFNDKETITADPLDGNSAYVVWDRVITPGQAGTPRRGPDPPDQIMFSRSTDGGATWSEPRVIGTVRGTPLANQIAVLPDGTLLNFYEATRPRTGGSVGSVQQVLRSTDRGASWSDPITIATVRGARTRDPSTRNDIRSGNALPEVGVDPRSGRAFVVWTDERFSDGTHTDVAISDSSDGGITWSAPRKVNRTPRAASAFTPAVAVAADGTVGVTYYDLRSDTAARGTLGADTFLARSSDGGATWQETRLTPESFDLSNAPRAGGYFLGDYMGLATTDGRFVAAYAIATDGRNDPTRMIVAIR